MTRAAFLVALFASLSCGGSERHAPEVKAAVPKPPSICVEVPAPPPKAISDRTNIAVCVPPQGLPLEVTVSGGSVVDFRFYSQCEGRVHRASKEVTECVRRSIAAWRYETHQPRCEDTNPEDFDRETEQLHLKPVKQNEAWEVGLGCA